MKRMKKLFALGSVVLIAGAASDVWAENQAGSFSFSPLVGRYFYDKDKDNLTDGTVVGLGLGYELTKEWGVEASFHLIDSSVVTTKASAENKFGRLDGIYNFAVSKNFVPYLAAGVGAIYKDVQGGPTDMDPFLNYGGGVKYYLATDFALRADVRHHLVFNDSRDNFIAQVGFLFSFGGDKKDKDSDGDGVIDQRDKCPDSVKGAKVDENGCVVPAPKDSDKDGVVDSDDRCPGTEAGVKVDKQGCPLDSDGDGVIDQRDKCPDTPKGSKVDENGCVPSPKDSDKDGVIDSDDRCPGTEAGVKVDKQGCPLALDSDGDGVIDQRDKCPDTPKGAKVDENGCVPAPKDSDKDGVVDNDDRCPGTEAGVKVDQHGCPLDSDGDGVIDQRDKCPDTPKGVKVDENGCVPAPKDSDKDGVIDSEDRCPGTEAGVKVDRQGCPLDSDKDGVIDQLDKCPDTPKGVKVDDTGCNIKLLQPVSMQIKIEFDVNKDEVKAQYHDELAKVADFMQTYPDANAEIEGHTDAAGSDDKNMALSQKRALSVVKYLIDNLGVKAERIKGVGYGESRPVASNDTVEGRTQNRRVVATLSGTALVDKK